jgi:hypothetical protein
VNNQNSQRGKLSPRLDVLEMFCGPNSQLTHQCQQLGFRAQRFSLQQGDPLFTKLVQEQPRHVWAPHVAHGADFQA